MRASDTGGESASWDKERLQVEHAEQLHAVFEKARLHCYSRKGHRQVAFTMRTYAHVIKETRQQFADKMDF